MTQKARKAALLIESDGTRDGTRLVTADGHEIPASRIEWSFDADGGVATAVVHLSQVPIRASIAELTTDVVVPALAFDRHGARDAA
ncbi:MAG: hypothetical protein M3292_09065 [Actinomycetota bacterium]|nr:hypothetical protein [Actinomycetota bacterium]